MSKCNTCVKQKYSYLCDGCIHDTTATDKYEPMTNADRIRAMSDKELAKWLTGIVPMNCDCCVYLKPCRLEYDQETVNYAEKYDCVTGTLEWLKQPAEVDHES